MWLRFTQGLLGMAWEAARLVWRRPVLGILAVAIDGEGRIVMIRRRDTGTWALPGGFAEWGERLEEALVREVREETGYEVREVRRVVGIYSAPRRDPRVHSVAVLVEAVVEAGPGAWKANPAEVIEVRAFAVEALPEETGYDTRELLGDYRRGGATVLR